MRSWCICFICHHLTAAAAAAAVVEESALNRSTDTSLTPKQLRFHLPKVEARAQLRSKGSSRLSADSDQLIEEEEVEDEEEEEMEEEEAVEEEEEEMEQTPELEEQVKADVEITVARLESERCVVVVLLDAHCLLGTGDSGTALRSAVLRVCIACFVGEAK